MSSGLSLGIGFLVSGLLFVLLGWGITRLLPKAHTPSEKTQPLSQEDTTETAVEAVVAVRHGGRLEYVNSLARELFDLKPDEPIDLERLARRVRPREDFLDLFVNEGKKRLSVNGRLVEATSLSLPSPYPLMLISLHRSEMSSPLSAESQAVSSSILRIVTDFGQAIAANLNLDATVQAVLENVSRLVPADMLEIKVWDADSHSLKTYALEEDPSAGSVLRRLDRSRFEGFSARLVEKREPLFYSNVEQVEDISLQDAEGRSLLRSYMGLPLLAGGELVGTLEVGQTIVDAFGQDDLDLLKLITGQAAVAIRNAVLYEDEQRHSAELTGLANLAQAVGSFKDPKDLFSRLIKSISVLFQVQILGFLLYDEQKRTLEGQVPFQGMPAHIVEIYRTQVEPESSAEKLLASHEAIITTDAVSDDRWQALGLQDFARAASLHESALIPLVTGGHFVGFLQLSNHNGSQSAFSAEELHLANIVANQAAAVIDNSVLVQDSRLRAQRSEALRQIASLSASTATLDEVLRFSLQELSHLLRADAAAVFMLDDQQSELRLHQDSAWGFNEKSLAKFARLYVDDTQFRETVCGSQKPFISGHLDTDERVISLYQPIAKTLKLQSAIVVPLVVRERSMGELMLGASKPEQFDNYDLQVVATAAGQLAAAVEGASLMNQTDETLRLRVEQLTALSRVNRELTATLDLKPLLEVVYTESLKVTGADCGSIILFDLSDEQADWQVALSIGCPVPDKLSSFEREIVDRGEPFVLTEFNHNDPFVHDGVRSALIIPIAYQGQTAGLLHLHSNRINAFGEDTVHFGQALAVQSAIAIGNARRYQEQLQHGELLRRKADTLTTLSQTSFQLSPDGKLEDGLKRIADGIRSSTPFQVVLVSVYDPETGNLRRVVGMGISDETWGELTSREQPLLSVKQLLKPQFKVSRSYFIPADETPIVPADVHMVTILNGNGNGADENSSGRWDPDDFLLIPLEDAEGNMFGMISLDVPRDGLRPDLATIESLEVFASQAALVINSSTKLSFLNERIQSLTDGIQRQQRLLTVSQNDLPILLHKDLEQTISIANLERRSQRIRAGLAITESVSRQLDASSALLALGREILTQLGMAVALVAEDTPDGPRLVHVLGSVPRATNPEALFGQRNPLRSCLQTGESMVVANLDVNDEWRETALLSTLHAKGFVCLPVTVQGKTIAAVLAISLEPMPPLTDEDKQVYFQIARQSSVILQNISLLSETRRRLKEVNLLLDFSNQLSGLDPTGIVQALLASALRVIPVAHAGAVLLWDERASELISRAVSGYADDESMMRIGYKSGEALPGRCFQDLEARRVDEVNFARDYTLSAESLLRYREATGGRLPISSMLVPIQSSGRGLGVLVLDNFNTPGAFQAEDETLLLSLTQQVALSLENVRLVQATTERAGQLQALNDVATIISSSLQQDELVASLLDQLRPVVPYDTATLWLRQRGRLEVAAASGFQDTDQRLGLTVAVEDSALFNQMIHTGQEISVADIREDERFHLLVEPTRLSWLGIPLISKGEVSGVIAMEKEEPGYYTREHIQVATTFSSQAAIAMENARLYEDSLGRAAELDQRSQRLALLNRFSSELSGLLDADQIISYTAQELMKALGAQRVLAVTFNRNQPSLTYALPKVNQKLPLDLPAAPLFEHLRESLGVFTSDNPADEASLNPIIDTLELASGSLLVLPLAGSAGLSALIFLNSAEGNRFSLTEIELARTVTNQAAIGLENARLYQSSLATAERFSVLSEVSFEISSSLDPEQIYQSIHQAVKRLMPVEAFVIALVDEAADEIVGVYLVDRDERAPIQHLDMGSGLSGQVIASGQPLLVHGAAEANELGGVTYGELGTPNSILAVPMFLGEKVIGMLSAQSYDDNVYTEEDQQILSTIANQAIVAIQNSRLFAETQRLADELEQRVVERTAQLQREQQNTETLLRILTEVSASLDLDRALNRTLALLNEAIGAEQGTIMLLNAEDNLLHYRAGYGVLTDKLPSRDQRLALKIGEGLAGWVFKNRESALINNLQNDPRWVETNTNTTRKHRSTIACPMLVGEDVIGVLMVFHSREGYFNPEQLNLVRAIGGQVAVAINNAHLYELIRDQAERLGGMLRREQEDASRSQAILEAVADGVLVTGPDNHITFVNSSAERILNLEADTVLGRSLDVFGGLFGKAANAWMQTIRLWSEDTSSFELGDSYAEQLELEDKRIVLVHLAPVILQNDFLGTVSIFRDITHEVEVDRLKSEFVATVSHELRTPMTSIRGYVDILLMGAAGALNENQVHFLDIVKNNTERLATLVNDLLDISRIEAGRITLSPQPIDIREMAEDVIADILRRSQDEEKPMALSLEAPKDLPRVYGDTERVRQILDNLVNNAYNYTSENGTITIEMHATEDDEVQVDVVDNGIGIPLSDQGRIFERFFRGENPYVLATPGTGLGLAIVRQLVEMHKGRIWMTSKGIPGEGSTFSFTLPTY